MKSFDQYLTKKGFTAATIKGYLFSEGHFTAWIRGQGLTIQQVGYPQLLAYIKYRQGQGQQKRYINHQLSALRHYFTYLVSEGVRKDNPAANLFLRGVNRRIPHDLLSRPTLDTLYEQYSVSTPRQAHQQAILGLLVFQALTTDELEKLQVGDIDLSKGQVSVSGSRRSNGRTLKLEVRQMLPLQEYLNNARPELLKANHLPIGKTKAVFFSPTGGTKLQNTLLSLMEDLRLIYPGVINASQLRMSVITEWLKTHNLRKVQHIAGHKYVSSTERYQTNDLEALQADLTKFHPLA